jgi:hypothetical protein
MSLELPLRASDKRQYRVTVTVEGREPRTETIWAPDWPTAWSRTIEQYGNTCRLKVAQYYTLMSNGERSIVCGELDLERIALEGFTPRSDPHLYDSWLEAKEGFGLDLTPMQQRLLTLRRG